MIRLSALNEDSSEESEPERTQESIRQGQEAEALELYNRALQFQQSGDNIKAEETYNLLLQSHLVKEAPLPGEDEGLHKPGQVLKYSAYKNLAVLAETKGDLEKATDAYLEAVMLDDSDVTVWYHIGIVAVKCYNLGLARQAFQEGLRCNPKHWPCLSELCSVLYAIGDYAICLCMIAEALERDESFIKGLALRDKMFSEEPYLRKDYQHLRILFESSVDEEDSDEAAKYVKEALSLREERLKLVEAYKKEPSPLEPNKPLTPYTWAALGECFVALYDYLTSPDNSQSLARRVNLEGYYKAIVTPDISMPHKASLAKMTEQVSASSFSTDGFHVYKPTGQTDGEDKPKKATKRKKPPISIDNEFPPKRRSARVRTSKKKEEEVNYKDLIQSFLPFSLRPSALGGDDESSQDSLADGGLAGDRGSQVGASGPRLNDSEHRNPYEGIISGEAETLDILTFVKEHMNNGGTIDLMIQYGIRLAAQRNKKWPPALADVLLKVYTRVRKHISLPPEFYRDNDEVYAGELAKLMIVATELTLEKLLTAKSKSSSSLSPASSPRGGGAGVSPIRVGPGFSSKYLATDVEYLHNIALDRRIHGDDWLEIAIRVNWAKARYLMLQGQMDIAMIYLDRCTKLLAVEVGPLAEPMTVKLVNCKIDNNITIEHVQKKLESLQRCQSLEEVHRLYEQCNFEDVVQLLMPTLHQPQPKTKVSELGMSIPERPAQLLLLQDSLIKLNDYKKCLMCSEVALNEAVSQMTPCEAWSTTLARLFQCINTCVTQSKEILDGFPHDKCLSLTLNIIKVIEASIYSSDNSLEPPLSTAYPWTLLYRIIKHNEKDEAMDVERSSKTGTPVLARSESPAASITANNSDLETASIASDIPAMSASLRFMHTAHDHLGRRGWCCNNDGVFLLLYVDALTEELGKPNIAAKEELVRDLEQCFLCLYAHPSKKAKTRGLQEHNSSQIPLTWENSAVVFEYFKPQELPTFDSKTNTISTEVQILMRRITLVVPQHEFEAISFDSVQAYVEGTSEEVPKLPERLVAQKRPVVGELFYLLADFYFKNKEFSKALKFYTHDVCVKPDRSDSWAAMALAWKSRLENKLNACEPKSEGPIQKHSQAALRCFKRAMETDSTNSSILEEYGSLCYFLHSHASRQLKQFDQVDASVDTRSSLSQRKKEMLLLSEKCFTTALGMEDSEAWLHHYMLGKIAEKLSKAPQIYLEHYEKSAKHLDDDIPSYPRKIPFYSPPDHVLEALEVYYRVHVSILKLLLSKFPDADTSLLEDYLQRAVKGPFYQPEYDVDSGQGVLYRTESTTSETCGNDSEEVPDVISNLEQATRVSKHETALATITEQSDVGDRPGNSVPDKQITINDEKPVAMETKDVVATGKPVTMEGKDVVAKVKDIAMATKDDVAANNSVVMETKDEVAAEKSVTMKAKGDVSTGKSVAMDTEDDVAADKPVVMETKDGVAIGKPVTMDTKYKVAADKPVAVDSNDDVATDKPLVMDTKDAVATNKPVTMDTKDAVAIEKPVTMETENDVTDSVPMESKDDTAKEKVVSIEAKDDIATEQRDDVSTREPVAMETDDVLFSRGTPHAPIASTDVTSEMTMEDGKEKKERNTEQVAIHEAKQANVCAPAKQANVGVLEAKQANVCASEAKKANVGAPEFEETSENMKEKASGAREGTQDAVKDKAMTRIVEQKQDVGKEVIDEQIVVETEKETLPNEENKEAAKSTKEASLVIEASAEKTGQQETENKESKSSENEKKNNSDKHDKMEVETNVDPCKDHVTVLPANHDQAASESSPLISEQKARQHELMDRCIRALEHCLRRFPQHHKSRYRLAYIAYYSVGHKDLAYSRDLLLGSSTTKPKPGRSVHQGLFNEKSKTNMFSSFWRIPEEDIDRPGSFCTHTYKSVDLLLRVLRDLNEWDTLLQVSNLLYRTPESGKKFLRDNERHFQARSALDYALSIMSERVGKHDVKDGKAALTQLVLDTYECWKVGQKYEMFAKMTENLLSKAFEMLKSISPISSDANDAGDSPSLLEHALRFCQQTVKPQPSSTSSSSAQSLIESSSESQADLIPPKEPVTVKTDYRAPKESKAAAPADTGTTNHPQDIKTVKIIRLDMVVDALKRVRQPASGSAAILKVAASQGTHSDDGDLRPSSEMQQTASDAIKVFSQLAAEAVAIQTPRTVAQSVVSGSIPSSVKTPQTVAQSVVSGSIPSSVKTLQTVAQSVVSGSIPSSVKTPQTLAQSVVSGSKPSSVTIPQLPALPVAASSPGSSSLGTARPATSMFSTMRTTHQTASKSSGNSSLLIPTSNNVSNVAVAGSTPEQSTTSSEVVSISASSSIVEEFKGSKSKE